MGYFSDYAIELSRRCREDHSYSSPKQQLRWRYEDLTARLREVQHQRYSRSGGRSFPDDELKYVLPEELCEVSQIERAIELAALELYKKYRVCVPEVMAAQGRSDTVDFSYPTTLFEMGGYSADRLPGAAA